MIELFKSKRRHVFIGFMALALVCLASGWLLHIEHARGGREQDASRPRIVDPLPEAASDERAPRRVVIPWELKVVGARCDLSSSALLDVLLDKGVSDCDNWEHVLVFDGESAMVPPGAMLVVEPRSTSILAEKILAWHEAHGALIRLDCSAPELPQRLMHVSCASPVGDMRALTHLSRLESLEMKWSPFEAREGGVRRESHHRGDGFSKIKALKRLKRLWLKPSEVRSDELAAIHELEELIWLELIDRDVKSWGPPLSGDAWISSIGRLSKLRTLVLAGDFLTDRDLVYLRDLHELRALFLDGLRQDCVPKSGSDLSIVPFGGVAEDGCHREAGSPSFLKRLSSLEHLHLLSLEGTSLEGHFIEDVRHLKALRVLAIQVDDARHLRLDTLEHLEALSLVASRFAQSWRARAIFDEEDVVLNGILQDTFPMSNVMVSWKKAWIIGVEHNLKVLALKGLRIRDIEARDLASRVELRGLHIVDSSVREVILSDDHLVSHLEALTLDRTCFSEAGLARARTLVPEAALFLRRPYGTRPLLHHESTPFGQTTFRREDRPWVEDYCADHL